MDTDKLIAECSTYFIKVKQSKPSVSVIIPAFNTENYIEECLVSLVKQTYKDFEVIITDDGSTDKTCDIARKICSLDSRFSVISQTNNGPSSARNAGIKNAKGQYITFLDSDDWVSENYIQKLYDAITINNCDIAVSEMVRKRKNSQKYHLKYSEEKTYESLQEKINACKIPKLCYVCGKLFKKELVQERLFKTGVYFEDVLWLPEVIKESTKLVTVPNAVYYYRTNNNSTVKQLQSIQKQHDSYKAKCYIIHFFEENNLILDEKYKHIKKYINYVFGFPVIKIKEYNGYETTLLFNLIPVQKKKISEYYKIKKNKKAFLIKKMDSHLYINFLGIHLGFKYKQNFEYNKAENIGISTETRTPKLIVSLASYPGRINTVYKTLNTLLCQTIKPDKLILWLADSQFLNKEEDLPPELLELKKYGLEIRWCEDLKSYKKLVPALREYPEDIIVTADDDLYYQKDWLESLYNAYKNDPKNIYTRRACRIEKCGNIFKNSPHYSNMHYEPDFSNQLMGGAGTIYPPHSLHEDVFNTDLIKELVPTYDDIYFWAMAVLKGTKIGLVKNKDLSIYNVEGTQDGALCKINGKNGTMSDKEAFNRIFERYPEIIGRI